MERWQGRVALVTGASAGIGAAIARRLAECGMIVVGCARNIDYIQVMSEELKSTGKGSLHALRCDLRKEEDILSMFSEIKAQHGGVDVCVNNAGLGLNDSSILYGKTGNWREIFEVNVMALTICTREAIKTMRERKVDDGHIVQMSSCVSYYHLPWPDGHWYSSSKWMVRAITDCLRMELRAEKSRIKVSAISPGMVKTEIVTRALGEEASEALYKSQESLSADNVADAVVTVLGTTEEVETEELVVMPTSGWTV